MKLKYLLIALSALLLKWDLKAQTPQALSGKNGIFINFGHQLPKDFTYLLERKTMEGKDIWKTIYLATFPKNIELLRNQLLKVNAKNAFYKMPDSTELTYFYKQAQQQNTNDSISYFNSSPLFLELMGTGFFDTEIKVGQKYEYRVSKIHESGRSFDVKTLQPQEFPGKAPSYGVEHKKTFVQGKKIGLYYHVKGSSKPFGFRVYRQYSLQSPFKEIYPNTTYFYTNDSLFLYLSDLQTTEKVIYKYFVQPFDLLGNTGIASDTIQVANVKEYDEVPLLTNFKSVSLDKEKSIKLSWQFPNTKNLRSISVYRSNEFDKGFRHLVSLPSSATEFIDARIDPVKTYYYYLVIKGAYGESPRSAKVAGMLKTATELVTAPQSIRIEQIADGNKISWRKVENGTIGYYIYRSQGYRTELQQYTDIIRSDSINVCFIDSIHYLKSGQPYSYAVVAVNANNSRSPISKRVIANPIKPELPTPLNLQVLKHQKGALLMWEDMTKLSPYITGYKVYRSTTNTEGKIIEKSRILNKDQLFGGNNSYTDSTIERGIKYSYSIKASGIEKSESALSSKVSFLMPKITPYPPSGLRAISSKEGIFLQWNSPVNEQIKSYKIYREKLGKKPKLVAEIESKLTDFLDKLPSKSTTYFYTISVVNTAGIESNRSDEVGINY